MDFSRVTPEVEKQILDFLNYARIPEDIAGSEPQSGPVHDDLKHGFGDQVKDYDIGILVASRMIEYRDSLPGKRYTSVQQLDAVKGFGQDKLDDLTSSMISTMSSARAEPTACQPCFCCRPRLALP